jgi:hypothetical protein
LLALQPPIAHAETRPSITDNESYVVVKELGYDPEESGGGGGHTKQQPALGVGTVLLAKELRPSGGADQTFRVRFATTDGANGWIDYETLQDRGYLQLFSRTDSYLRNLVASKRRLEGRGMRQIETQRETERGTEAAEDRAPGAESRGGRDEKTRELERFLRTLGLERYLNALVSEAVLSTDDLKLIEEVDELKALGVDSSFHQKKLLKAIKTDL